MWHHLPQKYIYILSQIGDFFFKKGEFVIKYSLFKKNVTNLGDFSPKKRLPLEEGILGEGIVF
jgi:hypothetical protein